MGGTVSGGGTYDYNQSVNAIAIPDSGFVFGGWSGDLTSSDANFSLTMNGNYELNASFYQEAAILNVQADPGSYGLYTEAEKNASYDSGVSDGNVSGQAYVQANLSLFSLYTEAEKNASDAVQYANGQAAVQANLAQGGLSSLSYFQNVERGQPYTSKWFYQPGLGWLWTDRATFPFLYRASDDAEGVTASWLFLNQSANLGKIYLYDYGSENWIELDF